MNHMLGASIAAGRVAVGVAASIKCRPYLDFPFMQMVKLFAARSFVNCKVDKNMKIDNTCHPQTQKNFPRYFRRERPAEMSVLDYLGTLDWESLQKHIIYFPRKRSDVEVRIMFEKWAAHYEKEYPSAELKEMRYATFKKRLDVIDEGNLKGKFTSVLKADCDIEG